MIELNFKQENKAHIEGEKNHSYSYYDFTEKSVREIANKDAHDVTGREWCSLVQMLYPENLISSGLFDAFLIFDIVKQKRKDPPKEHFYSLTDKENNGILLEHIISVIEEHGITVHKSWKAALERAAEAEKERIRNGQD